MAPKNRGESSSKKVTKKGAWTADEDRKLARYVEVHGPKRWKTVATKAGLNRCGKSCRLRWLNYLRPNIKRGNISDEEEDLIVRLHKLLGNRWSLIAGRLPGRTDNEIKNYWNSHLSKKLHGKQEETREPETPQEEEAISQKSCDAAQIMEEGGAEGFPTQELNLDDDDLFDFSMQGLDWVNKFLELDDDTWLSDKRY